MKATAQFDNAKHAVAIEYDVKLIGIRYDRNADHVSRFYMRKRSEFSQLQHLVGTDSGYDPIMSDA